MPTPGCPKALALEMMTYRLSVASVPWNAVSLPLVLTRHFEGYLSKHLSWPSVEVCFLVCLRPFCRSLYG